MVNRPLNFTKVAWERQKDNTWNKILYGCQLDIETKIYSEWKKARELKTGISNKEYFIRKLSDNL